MTALADVHNQVMWNRLISVVEEQALTLVRTAFSASVREAGDLSAGVFDREGRMMAQAVTGTPGHVNSMAAAVGHFIREIGEANIEEGDVYITNDPWLGTGHLHDITFVTPSFRNATLVGFFASTAHVVDVGGRGYGPDAHEVYEEGICIPIMPFAKRGEVDRGLIKIVRANVREPDQLIGDFYSLAACNETGHRRLMDMMDEYGLDGLEALRDFIFENSRAATLDALKAIPHGTAANTMTVDGFGAPVTLAVTLSVGPDGVHADYEGTSPVADRGINVPMIYTTAYTAYGLKCVLAPEIPNNFASLEPFTVSAPEGSILNAVHPAPVAVRHILGHFIPDTVFGALARLMPDVIPAEGAGSLWNIIVSMRPIPGAQAAPGETRQSTEVMMFNSGGSGARPTKDGLSATAFPSGVMAMPVEAIEHTGPLIFWRKEFREGSGGRGRQRGGLGQVVEIGADVGHHFHFNAMFDRVDHPARGREGGEAGAPGRVMLDDGTPMAAKGRQYVPPERRLVLELPGGGGFGPPEERDAELAERDRVRGMTDEG
ncbi:hydantoinase B/oxoprolinase family protein [Acuticoccus mangrovi]|uniref:Hydantoinase B/oxoprolinase family protein n=1 Tax=Acuticoccus mangrovi TaxID=2796142 RepID=A0A934IHR4_9HYPH|nr:hydantoinase B/oxoprolinase family protein [Acuticoccus mangrovi]MBJ3775216.1 hydantoinase B/oxoprolinase family protein [Acuticoccus mangrovi]